MNDVAPHDLPMCEVCTRRNAPTERIVGGLEIRFTGCDCAWNTICQRAFGSVIGHFPELNFSITGIQKRAEPAPEPVDMSGWLVTDDAPVATSNHLEHPAPDGLTPEQNGKLNGFLESLSPDQLQELQSQLVGGGDNNKGENHVGEGNGQDA